MSQTPWSEQVISLKFLAYCILLPPKYSASYAPEGVYKLISRQNTVVDKESAALIPSYMRNAAPLKKNSTLVVSTRLGQLDNSSFLITLIRAKCR